MPYLIRSLKKCEFRTAILINAYNSYAISHIIYSAPILTSCSAKAKSEMASFHKSILKILDINETEAIEKHRLHPIQATIDKICQSLMLKIVKDPDHPVTSCLAKNPRSTTVYNLYKTNIAKTEAHNQTFVLKYLRLLRDKHQEQKHNKNIKRLTNPKPATTKIKQPPILCQQCGISIKNKTGLSAHLRLNKKCNSTLVSAKIISSQNITLRR